MKTSLLIIFLLVCYVQNSENKKANRNKRSVVPVNLQLWPNAIVPYTIKMDASNQSFSDVDIQLILKAMSTIEEETCIKFRDIGGPPSFAQQNYLEIVSIEDRHCYSNIGIVGNGRQELILNSFCRSFGQIIHELAHTLGLMHELMRPDRDEYIVVHEDNIMPEFLTEFQKGSPETMELFASEFDFQSVTMYDPFSFTSGSKPSWEPLKDLSNIPLFPLRDKDLSYGDAAALNILYNCSARCFRRGHNGICRAGQYMNKYCRCQSAEAYAYRRCRDEPSQRDYCRKAPKANKCYDQAKYTVPFCRRTCGRCFRAGLFGNVRAPVKVCEDNEPKLCARFVQEGYCFFDSWTKINCRRSCKLCPSIAMAKQQTYHADARLFLDAFQKGLCFNRFDDMKCVVFAERGDCERNPSFMYSNCAQSCGACGNRTSPDLSYLRLNDVPCMNYIDDERCTALAKEGKCHGTTLRQCLASCNLCGPEIRERITTRVNYQSDSCKDRSPLCWWLAERGRCITHERKMLQHCPVSCNVCPTKCVDYEPITICLHMKSEGYCVHPNYAAKCRKTCNLCSTDETTANVQSLFKSVNDTQTKTADISVITAAIDNEQSGPSRVFVKATESGSTTFRQPRDRIGQLLSTTCSDLYPEQTCASWFVYCALPHVAKLCSKTCGNCY